MRNKIEDLRNHLFATIENLMDEDKPLDLDRAKAIADVKKDMETPAWIDIFKDYVVTIDVHGEPVCFLIRSRESAESYKSHFNFLWKLARK